MFVFVRWCKVNISIIDTHSIVNIGQSIVNYFHIQLNFGEIENSVMDNSH